MYSDSFYPTPPDIAQKMLARLDMGTIHKARLLEPSAGKGDLAEAFLRHQGGDRYSRFAMERMAHTVHCVEIHPELQAALRGKGFTVIASDFLTFWPDERYNLILMNPPFREGAQHLLHAWEILPHGDVLCLLNEQTLLNLHTSQRQQLAAIIEAHGEVEHLGSSFEEAERKTSVRVSLVHLHKAAEQPKFQFADGLEMEATPTFDAKDPLAGEIATQDMAANLVLAYQHARDAFMDVARSVQVLAHYSRIISTSSESSKALGEAVCRLMDSGSLTYEAQEDAYNIFVRGLKNCAWNRVFKMTKAESLMSVRIRKDFDELRNQHMCMAFNERNIAVLIETLFSNRHAILRQCVLDAFDYLTEFHKENRLLAEGWKTNDAWRVNKKFILPYIVSFEWGHFSLSFSNSEKLRDLDRAMASLEGKRLEQVSITIIDAIQSLIRECREHASGVEVSSDYFHIRIFKKGTAHFVFRDTGLWERFNLEAAKGKNWLPDDCKARHQDERRRNRMADRYGLPLTGYAQVGQAE